MDPAVCLPLSCPIAQTVRATKAVATVMATFASIDNFMAFLLDFRL
jgi:hypothetical protein